MFEHFTLNMVVCALLEALIGVLLPEGKMKKFTMLFVSYYLFYIVVELVVNSISYI